MVRNNIHKVPVRRKREGKTDYRKRMALLMSGKPRLVIRASLANIHLQIVSYQPQGDVVMASADSKELAKLGYGFNRGNIPAAYLTGLLLGRKAQKKGITEAILDLGLQTHHAGSRIYAALKGVIDAGVSVPASPAIFPPKERLMGGHIESYAQKLKKEGNEQFQKQFSRFLTTGKPEEMRKAVEGMKAKIMQG